MIKVYFKKSVVTAIVILLNSCAQASWNGHYLCEFPVGEVAGGYYAFINYDLTIESDLCSLSIEGYQSGNKFICDYDSEENRLSVFFKDYAERRFKADAYKGHELLFELVKQGDGLFTHWGELYPLTKEPPIDHCFQRQ